VRLTLRTLLAYLDDTLDPAEIKRIGQKVAESETARELIARIKSVTRRRRLTTPPLSGTADKFDANTVAEYLDNTLPPEKVEEIEEICLESDVHLAEIAACHQILTLVLGEPALVPPSAKRRMVALAGEGRSSAIRKTLPPAAAASTGRHLEDSGEDDALLLGLPALRRGQGAWLRWLLPLAGCLLLAALVAVIIMALPRRNDYAPRKPSDRTGGPIVADAGQKGAPPVNGKENKTETNNGKTNGDTGKDGKTETEATKNGKPLEKDANTKPKVEAKTLTTGSTKAPVWSAAPPSNKQQPLGKLVRNAAMQDLVIQGTGGGAWRRLVANGRFSGGDALVSLPGYQGELALDNGLHLILWGNVYQQLSEGPILESAILAHAAEPDKEGGLADFDFTLSRGRVWIVNQKKEDQPAYVRLRFHKEIWDLTLQPGTEVGMELVGREIGLKPILAEEGPAAMLLLVVKKGKLTVRDDLREFPPMVAPAAFHWDNVRSAAPSPAQLSQWPSYWEQPVHIRQGVPGGPEMNRALDALRKRLTEDRQIGSLLAETLDAAEGPTGRALTVLCFGALDYVEDLIECLVNVRYPDVRDAAVDALRHWLGRGSGQRDRFRQVLERKFSAKTEVDTILHLLRMPGAEDLQERETYSFPIDQLNNDNLAIRHLAFWHLQRMANKEMKENKLFFDPAGPPEQRDSIQRKWKKLLDDGKLLPDQLRNQSGGGAGRQ
jgi:hypothetical protein